MTETRLSNPEFQHAMLREIYEQPEAITATLAKYLLDGSLNLEPFRQISETLHGNERIVIAASGSSRHAGLAAEIMLEDLVGLTVDVEYASEYCYRSTHTLQDPGVIVISQSGETADTLAALREATGRRLPTVAITNHPNSSMAREANASLPTFAGIEESIPATKSFTTQLTVLYLLTLNMARLRGRMTNHAVSGFCEQLSGVPASIHGALPAWEEQARAISERMKSAKTLLYLGRGIHYAIAREGALKLKESAYVHAEGLPSGELKHGPNALVNKTAPLVILATQDCGDPDSVLRYGKTLQLIQDLHAQKAVVLALVSAGDKEVSRYTPHTIAVPAASEYLLPILEVVPLQLIAYFSAVLRGVDVDRPRNLVKAVVQE